MPGGTRDKTLVERLPTSLHSCLVQGVASYGLSGDGPLNPEYGDIWEEAMAVSATYSLNSGPSSFSFTLCSHSCYCSSNRWALL